MDTSYNYGQFALPLGERKPLYFLQIQPTEYGHLLIQTLSMAPFNVCIKYMGFDCIYI